MAAEPLFRASVCVVRVVRVSPRLCVAGGVYRVVVRAGRAGRGRLLYESPVVGLFALHLQINRALVWARSNVTEVYTD